MPDGEGGREEGREGRREIEKDVCKEGDIV